MKSHYVKDLHSAEIGVPLQCVFRFARPELRKKTGGTYLTCMLADKTGEIEAVWWEGREDHLKQAKKKPYALISGSPSIYKGKRQVIVETILEWADKPEELADFLAVATLPLEVLLERLQNHIASVNNPFLKPLLDSIFGDVAFRKRFDDWPGAKTMHHACCHGLLQHTLEVTDLASVLVDTQRSWRYVPLSRELVIAGALLHDIGKVYEITDDGGGNYGTSPTGELLGHITIGQQWIAKKISKLKGFPVDLRDAVLHIIGSHHGKREFGSSVPPMFTEAQIVHMADQSSVDLYYIQEATQSSADQFVKVWKIENQRFSTRSWADLDTAPTIVKEAPVTYAPHAPLPQPGRTGLIPAFRFHSGSGEAHDNTAFHTRRLPLVGRAAAGEPRFAEEHIEGHFDVADEGLGAGEFYLLEVEGASMTGDDIQDGDMVIVRKQASHQPDEIAVVYFDDRNEATLKRVRQTNNGGVELVSSNPDNPPIIVADPSSLRICGRVVGVLRN